MNPTLASPRSLADELVFQLSLLRLLTEPHNGATAVPASVESRQIEELVCRAASSRKGG